VWKNAIFFYRVKDAMALGDAHGIVKETNCYATTLDAKKRAQLKGNYDAGA
jgi:hypothetical protein